MVRRHQSGGFNVQFPMSSTSQHRIQYLRLDVHQKIREHDTAVIRIRSKNMDWFKQFSSGTPVRVSYWSSNYRQNKGVFIGYVTHVRLVTDDGNAYVRDIVCVAASRDLRETAQKTYVNMSAPEIVTSIGKLFRLKVITKQHGLRRGTVVQSGETYWEFLNKLAKRSGYVLRVSGTTLYFLPLREMIGLNIHRAPVLTDYASDTRGRYDGPNVESIDSWVGDTSDDKERLTDQAVFTSISPLTGEVASVVEKPISGLTRRTGSRSQYTRFMSSNTTAHSRHEATILAKGAADNGLMAIDVNLTVSGNPLLSPYHPVELSIRDQALSGYWLVKEVTHTIVRGEDTRYLADVTVATDAVDGLSGYRRRRNPALRDLAPELTSGVAPNEGTNPMLVVSRSGFVAGTPANGNAQGRWVHR